jgi:hypothetical protein
MPSSGIWNSSVRLRTDVSEEHIAPIIRVEIICNIERTATSNCVSMLQLPVPANVVPSWLMMEAIISSEMSVLRRPRLLHILQDGILHSHLCEILKSHKYIPDLKKNIHTIKLIPMHGPLISHEDRPRMGACLYMVFTLGLHWSKRLA